MAGSGVLPDVSARLSIRSLTGVRSSIVRTGRSGGDLVWS